MSVVEEGDRIRLNARMRAAILYAIGVGTMGFGFYEFWRDGTVNQQLFVIGGTCLGAAAALQIVQDLWRRFGR